MPREGCRTSGGVVALFVAPAGDVVFEELPGQSLFAGYDKKRLTGRLFEYDVTGGRYEEQRLRRDRLGRPARRHLDQARLPRRA